MQLVSSEGKGGFQEGGCVEGEGEGVHRFSGLLPVTYTVLVYGLAAGGGEDSCSPAPGDPDYITVATVHGPHPSSVNNQPSPTNSMSILSIYKCMVYQLVCISGPLVIPNPWCAEGKQPCSILVVYLNRYKQALVLVYVWELLLHVFCL